MTRPTVLFIFGMGRSGTSALTRVLSLAGAELPRDLLGPTPANERGYWEPARAFEINEAFLRDNGSSWYDPSLRLQELNYVTASDEAAYLHDIKDFLASCPEASLIVIKEPRIAALSKYWMRAVDDLSFDAKFVIPVRRPAEVIGSLTASPYLCTPELAIALWIKYNLLAERFSRGKPRVFVEYSRLLENWRREVARIVATLEVELGTKDDATIESFLEGGLNHHAVAEDLQHGFLSTCKEMYGCLACASRDEHFDERIFDRCYAHYAFNERFFREAFGDCAKRT